MSNCTKRKGSGSCGCCCDSCRVVPTNNEIPTAGLQPMQQYCCGCLPMGICVTLTNLATGEWDSRIAWWQCSDPNATTNDWRAYKTEVLMNGIWTELEFRLIVRDEVCYFCLDAVTDGPFYTWTLCIPSNSVGTLTLQYTTWPQEVQFELPVNTTTSGGWAQLISDLQSEFSEWSGTVKVTGDFATGCINIQFAEVWPDTFEIVNSLGFNASMTGPVITGDVNIDSDQCHVIDAYSRAEPQNACDLGFQWNLTAGTGYDSNWVVETHAADLLQLDGVVDCGGCGCICRCVCFAVVGLQHLSIEHVCAEVGYGYIRWSRSDGYAVTMRPNYETNCCELHLDTPWNESAIVPPLGPVSLRWPNDCPNPFAGWSFVNPDDGNVQSVGIDCAFCVTCAGVFTDCCARTLPRVLTAQVFADCYASDCGDDGYIIPIMVDATESGWTNTEQNALCNNQLFVRLSCLGTEECDYHVAVAMGVCGGTFEITECECDPFRIVAEGHFTGVGCCNDGFPNPVPGRVIITE